MIREIEPGAALGASAGAQFDASFGASRPEASEDMVQRALGVSHAIAWEWHLESGECRRSGPVREELGIAPNAPASAFQALIHPADLPMVNAAIERTRDRLETLVLQFRLVLANGEERWVEASGTPLLDDLGRCASIRGVLLNITARKRVEQKLADTERQLAQECALLRQIHDLSLLDANASHPWQMGRQLLDLALSAGDAQIAVLHHRHPVHAGQLVLDRVHTPVLAGTISQMLAQQVLPLCEQVLTSGQRLQLQRGGDSALAWSPEVRAVLATAGIGGLQCTPLRSRSGRIEGTLTTLWCGPRTLSDEHLMLLDVVALKLAETLQQPSAPRFMPTPALPERDIVRLRMNELTPQQTRIAELLAAGRSNRDVANALGIAENTVKAHVSTVLRRLGLHNRTQVALLAQQRHGADEGTGADDAQD